MQLNIKVKRAYLFTFSLSLVSFLLIVNDIKHLLWTLIFIYVFCYLLGLIVVDILKIDNSYNNIVLLIAIGISIILIFYNYWFLLNIKLPKILLISLFVILFIYGLYIFYRNFIQNIFQLKNYFINNATIEEIAIYVFIFILLFTVLFPLRKLYVAPLHDPVAISLLSKRIAQGGFTLNLVPNSMRFYPNGFAILVSVIGGIFNLDFAKEVLYATNIFNLMVGVSFYYLGKEIFKKDISGIACFFISSFLSYFPLSLYYIAGKNSQIFGYFISIFTAYFIIKIISNNEFNRKNIILLALLTAGSHYAHYNSTVFLFGIYTTVLFIIIIFRNEYKNKLSNLLLNYGITILCTVVLLIPNILIIKNSGGIKFDVTSRVIISNISVISIMHSFFVHIKLSSGILLKYIWWCGLFTIIPIIILKKYYWLKQYIFIFGILLWTIFTTSGFPEKLHLFFISSNFSTMLIFIPPVLFCTLFISFLFEILPKRTIRIFLFISIAFALMSGSWRFSRYEHARKLSVVKEADIATFKWINKNIKDNNYFIGRVEFANTSFLIDASLYLTYFCEKDILLNFVPSEIFNRDKNDDIELYKKWIHGFGKESTIRELLDKNITYVYLGKYPYFGDGGISRDSLEKYREYYKLIYDKDGATIWKISVF